MPQLPNPDLALDLPVPDLLILRHGETDWNRAGRLQGALDSPLTGTGRAQAIQQGDILAALGVSGWTWISSPQGRARDTARIARGDSGQDISVDPRLREIGMGDWTGRLRSEIADEVPHLYDGAALTWYDHAPGGEGIAALAARVADFVRDLNGPSVIVTHGITSRVLRCLATGRPASEFGTVEGGQGVVFRVSGGDSRRLDASSISKPA